MDVEKATGSKFTEAGANRALTKWTTKTYTALTVERKVGGKRYAVADKTAMLSYLLDNQGEDTPLETIFGRS